MRSYKRMLVDGPFALEERSAPAEEGERCDEGGLGVGMGGMREGELQRMWVFGRVIGVEGWSGGGEGSRCFFGAAGGEVEGHGWGGVDVMELFDSVFLVVGYDGFYREGRDDVFIHSSGLTGAGRLAMRGEGQCALR